MHNFDIAINWFNTSCTGDKVIMSDKALKPFNLAQRVQLILTLRKSGIATFSMGRHGLVCTRMGAHVCAINAAQHPKFFGIVRSGGNVVAVESIGWSILPSGKPVLHDNATIEQELRSLK